ncbi:MAG: dipeptidase [Bellilinea sp.]
MPRIIDAHQDIAYNMYSFGRDYRQSAAVTRARETGTRIPELQNGQSTLGWPEYQQAQLAVIFATLFVLPRKYKTNESERVDFATLEEAYRLTHAQMDIYNRLADESPDQFTLVKDLPGLAKVLNAWEGDPTAAHPVGLVLSMEGAEGVSGPAELEEWWEQGVRLIGPVWAGTRYCGGTYEGGRFTSEGFRLLENMANLGYTLDIAHMKEEPALQALDRYSGAIIASHANARALLKEDPTQRHLTDTVIRSLVERDGIIGVVPFNRFLLSGWKNTDPREQVTLEMVVDHIDHICQIAGDALHVGLGTDYDGGFGWPAIPLELNTIADLPKLAQPLTTRGYSPEEIEAIFSGNWQRLLEHILPA